MTTYVTKHEIWMYYGAGQIKSPIVIPAGTRCVKAWADHYHVDDLSWLDRATQGCTLHDATYYGILVTGDQVVTRNEAPRGSAPACERCSEPGTGVHTCTFCAKRICERCRMLPEATCGICYRRLADALDAHDRAVAARVSVEQRYRVERDNLIMEGKSFAPESLHRWNELRSEARERERAAWAAVPKRRKYSACPCGATEQEHYIRDGCPIKRPGGLGT